MGISAKNLIIYKKFNCDTIIRQLFKFEIEPLHSDLSPTTRLKSAYKMMDKVEISNGNFPSDIFGCGAGLSGNNFSEFRNRNRNG